ncbi:MAG: asparagine synthase (glutamine-hydrolyzing) [Vicinamibacterales bacterium]
MCGIAAIAARDASRIIEAGELAPMVASLVHRGPDEGGALTRPGAALGMRRLSIIDLTHGHQPLLNEDGSIIAVANGEIYNFHELRRELEARGHVFRSRTDVEVIPHAYEEYGPSFVTRLKGMFALTLWDQRRRTLLAARDRAGEKPLYYAETPDGLVLGSEIKAVLAAPGVTRELDPVSLDQFLTYEYVIAPRTIFKQIRRLPAAHVLTYREGRTSLQRYWDAAAIPVREWRDDEAAEALREALGRAVESQMMSDVPLGVFLSGGIDSSAITAFMAGAARRNGAAAINSFSMGFEDGSYNELPFARLVAQHFGTNHREQLVTPDVARLFDRLVVHMDEPFGDVSLFPTFMVSELARPHVTVVLAGDGGDELFAGYDSYEAQALAARVHRVVPDGAIRAIERITSLFPPSDRKKGLVNMARRFFQGAAGLPRDLAQFRWTTFLPPAKKARLYTPGLQQLIAGSDVYAPVREALGARRDDPLNAQLYADLTLYLADDILTKVDRMSMAASLETRAPFLDVDVMELAFSMPGHLKMRGRDRKHVLKQALRGIVPEAVLTRKKEGFSIPMKQWLRHELAGLTDVLLSPERVRRRGLFAPSEVARLIREHRAGTENHAHTLFPLLVFERWAEHFLDAPAPPQ